MIHSGVWGPPVAVGGTAAEVSGKVGGVFSGAASIRERGAVSNCMMLVVVRSGERRQLQPMPASPAAAPPTSLPGGATSLASPAGRATSPAGLDRSARPDN